MDYQLKQNIFSFLSSVIERECEDLLNSLLCFIFQGVICHQQGDINLFVHPVVEVADRNDHNSQNQFSPHEITSLSEKLLECLNLRLNNESVEDVVSTVTEIFMKRTLSNVRLDLDAILQRGEMLTLVRSIVLPSCKILCRIKLLNALICFDRVVVNQKV